MTFHRTRRNAQQLTSELDQIPGVGEKTVQKLLKQFGSSEMVRQASEEELARVVGERRRGGCGSFIRQSSSRRGRDIPGP